MGETRRYKDRKDYNIRHVTIWRKKIKLKAVEHRGGKCMHCGYCKYPEVLEFHHRDPSQKEFGLGLSGLTRSWERVKKEIEKCDLLCANCHREQHVEERRASQKINDIGASMYVPQSGFYPLLVNP